MSVVPDSRHKSNFTSCQNFFTVLVCKKIRVLNDSGDNDIGHGSLVQNRGAKCKESYDKAEREQRGSA